MKLAISVVTVLLVFACGGAQAVVLEGVGHATIYNDDVDSARQEAKKAALRDVSLQYEARISSRDTMENGVVTESRLQVASSARATYFSTLPHRLRWLRASFPWYYFG